jgi:hypothetical protein
MSAPPTITQIKEHFVANQVLQLSSSTSLNPSPAFQAANEQADQSLDPRHIQSAVTAVEGAVQAHYRRIFVPQANRAVAEQISDTYTKEADRKLRRDGDEDVNGDGERGDGIGKELDLADAKTIASLPAAWPSERDVTAHPMEAKRYADAVQTLAALQAEREELKLRVQRLRRLQAIVGPLKTTSSAEDEEGSNSVQDNIVTRGGAVEKELERMRMLLVRVVGRVGTLPEAEATGGKGGQAEVESFSVARKRDLDSFLADSKVFPRDRGT